MYINCDLGNIDQVQYCEKVKGIVDFLGSEITTEELAMIWKMQVQICTLYVFCFVETLIHFVFSFESKNIGRRYADYARHQNIYTYAYLIYTCIPLQVGQTNHVIDNIHSIIAAAAVKFDSAQLEHLFLLIQKVKSCRNS